MSCVKIFVIKVVDDIDAFIFCPDRIYFCTLNFFLAVLLEVKF